MNRLQKELYDQAQEHIVNSIYLTPEDNDSFNYTSKDNKAFLEGW